MDLRELGQRSVEWIHLFKTTTSGRLFWIC